MWIHATIPNSGINVFRYPPEAGGFTSHLVTYSLYGAFAWETTHRRQGHMMLSPMGKCPIKCKDLFDLKSWNHNKNLE